MTKTPIDFGDDSAPIDQHIVLSEESFADAITRIRREADAEAAEARRRMAPPPPLSHPGVDGNAHQAMCRSVQRRFVAIRMRRNRRIAEWLLADHARWMGLCETAVMQRVVARTFSQIGAFFDPSGMRFCGVDVEQSVRRSAVELGLSCVIVPPRRLLH